MKYAEVAKRLRGLGCHEVPASSGGSHRRWYCGASGTATTVPDWGSKDLRPGTLRAIVRQLGLSWDEFRGATR
jgi:predicted RNA binding protein YcfA (HicA-like mRNA interferase family)